jgi:hypothetical protein
LKCKGPLNIGAVNNIGKMIAQENAADYAIPRGVGEVGKEVDNLVGAYHDLWRRPFPTGLEKGQILTAAVFERLMRTLLDSFEQEPRAAIAKYGSTTINLSIVLQANRRVQPLAQFVTE